MKLLELAGSGDQRIGHIQKLVADGILTDDLRHRRVAERGADYKLAVVDG